MGWRRRRFTPGWRRWYRTRRHSSPSAPVDTTPPVVTPPSGTNGTIQLETAVYTIQDSAGNLIVNVDRTLGVVGAVTVAFATSPGTAVPGTDYTTVSGTLSWADGDSGVKQIVVPILRTLQVGSVTFTVAISNPTGGALLGSPTAATVTIQRNSNGILTFDAAVAALWQVQDPNAGFTTVTVNAYRKGAFKGAVSASWATADGTAIAGTDYTAASGTVSWADGEGGAKPIVITIIGRAGVQPNRNFFINLSAPVGGAVLDAATQATVTIVEVVPPANPATRASPPQQLLDPVFAYFQQNQFFDYEIGTGNDNVLFNGLLVNKIGTVIGFGRGTSNFGGGTDLANNDNSLLPSMTLRQQGYIVN